MADDPTPRTSARASAPRPTWRFDLTVALVALVCGAVFAIVIPPLGGYDEPLHFLRAWEVSDGGVFARQLTARDGTTDLFAKVPRSLPPEMRAILRDGVFHPHDAQSVYRHLGDRPPHGPKTYEGLEGAGDYSPVPYLPAALVIRVGRAFGLSTLALIELARLAQIVAYALIVGLAVRRIKYRSAVLAVLALAPVALIQVGTVSADPLTTALTLLLIAEASHLLSLRADEIGRLQLVEVAVALVALALAKPPYVLAGALLVAPMWRHRGRIAAEVGAALAVAVGFAIAWNHWAQNHFVLLNKGFPSKRDHSYAFHNVAPSAQSAYVRSHPLSFLATVARTIAHYPTSLLHDAFAQSPSWRPPGFIVVCVLVLVACSLAASPESFPGGWLTRLIGIALGVALLIALFFLAYVGWNALRAPRIDEFQGRYLLPVVAVLALVAAPGWPRKFALGERAAPALVAGSAALALWVTIGMVRFLYF